MSSKHFYVITMKPLSKQLQVTKGYMEVAFSVHFTGMEVYCTHTCRDYSITEHL